MKHLMYNSSGDPLSDLFFQFQVPNGEIFFSLQKKMDDAHAALKEAVLLMWIFVLCVCVWKEVLLIAAGCKTLCFSARAAEVSVLYPTLCYP